MPLAIASGLAGLKPGTVATERDMPEPFPGAGGRVLNERAALALAERGVRAMSVRFAPTVHGDGDHGFVAMIVPADRTTGSAAYIDAGINRWPAVHRSDAARLVRLGLEGAPAGSVLHAVGEQGVAIREIAEAIGRGLDLPVNSITAEQAAAQFGFLAGFLGLDIPASSALTRRLLSWEPSGPGLVDGSRAGPLLRRRGGLSPDRHRRDHPRRHRHPRPPRTRADAIARRGQLIDARVDARRPVGLAAGHPRAITAGGSGYSPPDGKPAA